MPAYVIYTTVDCMNEPTANEVLIASPLRDSSTNSGSLNQLVTPDDLDLDALDEIMEFIVSLTFCYSPFYFILSHQLTE